MLLALLSQLFNFCRAISYLPLHIRLPLSFSLPSSTSTVWVISRKAADSDKSLSEKQDKKNPTYPTCAAGQWGLRRCRWRSGSSCQSPHRSMVGGAFISWRHPFSDQVHLCLLLTLPTGASGGIMGAALRWACLCQSVIQLHSHSEHLLLILAPPSSYRFPVNVRTERKGTGKSCSCVQSCQV